MRHSYTWSLGPNGKHELLRKSQGPDLQARGPRAARLAARPAARRRGCSSEGGPRLRCKEGDPRGGKGASIGSLDHCTRCRDRRGCIAKDLEFACGPTLEPPTSRQMDSSEDFAVWQDRAVHPVFLRVLLQIRRKVVLHAEVFHLMRTELRKLDEHGLVIEAGEVVLAARLERRVRPGSE